mmetsp:Transcript_2650/g.5955  ORF Transcript_2650/g.5955 Transcript_2650/m.5955 type:complete len:132 (-) Transcript_2650:340-735(-)
MYTCKTTHYTHTLTLVCTPCVCKLQTIGTVCLVWEFVQSLERTPQSILKRISIYMADKCCCVIQQCFDTITSSSRFCGVADPHKKLHPLQSRKAIPPQETCSQQENENRQQTAKEDKRRVRSCSPSNTKRE